MIYVGPNGRISDQDLTDNEGPPNEIHPVGNNSISLSDCIDNQSRFVNRKVNIVKPMKSQPLSNSASENNDVDANDSPVTPVKNAKSAPKGSTAIGDFIVSDCDDVDGRQSPCFGPRGRQVVKSPEKEASIGDKIVEQQNDEHSLKRIEELGILVESDDDDDGRIDLCSALKSRRQALKFDENANEKAKEEDIIEVFVEDDQNKSEKVLEYDRMEENRNAIVSDIISKTRPKVDYFHHEAEDEYLHMGPVTEKELRKSERRIKRLLKGGLIDSSHVHTHSTVDDSYMSECEAGKSHRGSVRHESSGYCSAPETENRRRRLQKIFTKSIGSDDAAPKTINTDLVTVRPETRVTSPTKRLSAEETRSLLKDFVAKKIEERALSPDRDENNCNERGGNDLVANKESFVHSSFAEVKYVPTCKANIASTRLCRGSFSSVQSSEANSFSPPSSETSYDKADTISMASYAGSEDRNEVAGLSSPLNDKSVRRKRSPIKIHYRWSTVFEEDEKAKAGSQKSVMNNDKQSNENKKTKSNKKTNELPSKPDPSKSPKVESKMLKKSPKPEQKRDKLSKLKSNITSSPNISKSLHSTGVGSSSHSVSGCSELSESSGIASNDGSSLSQQSFQSSSHASCRDQPICSNMSPVSPPTRRWFFR